MTKLEQKMRKIFTANKTLRVLYAFQDGNIFSDKNFALNHQRACGKDMEVVNREDLPKFVEAKPEPTPAKRVATRPQPAPAKRVATKPQPPEGKKPEQKLGKAKEPKAKKVDDKHRVITLTDQLLSMNLENPEGALYNVYKQIRDGLGIKTENNRMVTIVAALADEQKKLKSKKPD